MFAMVRQLQAFFKLPTSHQTHTLFLSLASGLIESSSIDTIPDEASIVVQERELWRDYAAVGFDVGGNLLCRTETACWD
jgi:hypothetical protein